MAPVTVRRDGSPIKKPFTWSYSRLKNYEVCPLRHLETDILKNVSEDDEDNENLRWGDRVHKTAAARLGEKAPLPPDTHGILDPWVTRLEETPGKILVERKYAITKSLEPCGYFASNVWFRGIADVLKISGRVALAVDWKTGKIVEDSVQLALMAQCIFSHHPEIMKLRTEFIWLKEDATTREDFTREDMPALWAMLIPRVEKMRVSHETGEYPATPNRMCGRFCGVKKCGHHGNRY